MRNLEKDKWRQVDERTRKCRSWVILHHLTTVVLKSVGCTVVENSIEHKASKSLTKRCSVCNGSQRGKTVEEGEGTGAQPTPFRGLPEDIRGLSRTVLCHPNRGNLPDLCVTSIIRPVREGGAKEEWDEMVWATIDKIRLWLTVLEHYWQRYKVA